MELEIRYLSRLADELFELSQLDPGAQCGTKEPGSLHDLVSDTLECMQAQALEKGVA